MILSDIILQTNATSTALNHLVSQLGTGNATTTDTGITGLILAIVGIASAITESLRRNAQSNSRIDNINKSGQERNDSLKGTDAAVKDHSDLFQQLTELLMSDSNLRNLFEQRGRQFLDSVNRNVIEWSKDFSAYYDKMQSLPEDSSKDATIRKMAEIRKSLSPDYSGIPPTTNSEVREVTNQQLKNSRQDGQQQ
jgi:hypothetical protein